MSDQYFNCGMYEDNPFPHIYYWLRAELLEAPQVDVGEWHAMDVKGKKELVSCELREITFHTPMPDNMIAPQAAAANMCGPNLPWAENQFQERVSREPLNPGETYKEWPWQGLMDQHVNQVFSHTYMERYWPKFANRKKMANAGIRYPYGDLDSVIALLAKNPLTRQAYLPVFFPEDTGAVHGGRIPCTLGYHFLLRDGKLHCSYYIRSCDFVRHLRDDVYLTVRLAQWVLEELRKRQYSEKPPGGDELRWHEVILGTLSVHIGSLHFFEGDRSKLEKEVASGIPST